MFHEVCITRTIQDAKGNDKVVSEKYLTENKEFLAESEQLLMQEFNGECEVTSVKQSNIREFINQAADYDQDVYLIGIEDLFVDENTGEEKTTKYVVGCFALSVEEATKLACEYMKQGMTDLRLSSVKRTKIVGLFN